MCLVGNCGLWIHYMYYLVQRCAPDDPHLLEKGTKLRRVLRSFFNRTAIPTYMDRH